MHSEQSGEMSCPDTHPSREHLDSRTFVIKRTFFCNQARRALYGGAAPSPRWTEWSGFRSAPETWAEPRRFGGSGTREETDVARMCRTNRADGPTIDTGGSDAGKEASVVGRITAHPRSLAFSMVEQASLHDLRVFRWTESDSGERPVNRYTT